MRSSAGDGRRFRAASAVALAVALAGSVGPARSAAKPAPPAALATAAVNELAKKPALHAAALSLGRTVYGQQCASCHGADLKGLPDQHTPNLTDSVWLFSGDDLESGGITMFPSDVEKTVLYGIRSGHPKARNEASMPGFGPAGKNLLTDAEITDLVEHLISLSGRAPSSAEAAGRGKALFAGKGVCWDCHGDDGTGNGALGSTDFTTNLWLYGGDRASLTRSITEGATGVMPAFEGKLSPAEIKAVAVYVYEKAPR